MFKLGVKHRFTPVNSLNRRPLYLFAFATRSNSSFFLMA